jgi:hypothetical protein
VAIPHIEITRGEVRGAPVTRAWLPLLPLLPLLLWLRGAAATEILAQTTRAACQLAPAALRLGRRIGGASGRCGCGRSVATE